MSDLQYKSSQKYFTVFQFLNPNGITRKYARIQSIIGFSLFSFLFLRNNFSSNNCKKSARFW